MALKASLRWRVVAASAVALALCAAAMTVALVAAAGIRAEGRKLSHELVPAAAAAGNLLDGYQTEQNWLRGYVSAGHRGPLTALDDAGTQLRAGQDRIARLARGYPAVTRQLAATVAARQTWRADVADPELGAMARGDTAEAQALQAEMAVRRAGYFADPPSRPIEGGLRMSGQRRDGRLFPAEITLSGLPTDSRILARSGYQVCVVDSGSEAVRRASDPDQPIDLLLTDVVMPEMLGNEVAARVGEIRPGVPALFMSGYARPILDTHGIPSPHYDILEKPFTEAALLTRVRRALTRSA